MIIFFEPQPGQLTVIQPDAVISLNHQSSAELTDYAIERGANITDHVRSYPDALTCDLLFSNTPLTEQIDDFFEGSQASVRQYEISLKGPKRVEGPPRLIGNGLQTKAPLNEVGLGALALGADARVVAATLTVGSRLQQKLPPPSWETQKQNETSIKAGVATLQWSAPFDRARRVFEELERLKSKGVLCGITTTQKSYFDMVLISASPYVDETTGDALRVQCEFRQTKIADAEYVRVVEPKQQRAKPKQSAGQVAPAEPTTEEVAVAEKKKESFAFSGGTAIANAIRSAF